MEIDGFAFDVEIIARAIKKGYSGIEIPVSWKHVEGSKVSITKAVPEMFKDVILLSIELGRS